MMTEYINIDLITLILSAILLVFALTTPFLNGFFRRPKGVMAALGDGGADWSDEPDGSDGSEESEESDGSDKSEEPEKPLPPVSIILTPHENGRELEENLPLYLDQDYPSDYEVVVVVWKGDAETEDVLKRFADQPRLYTTYIPDSSRYMSRKKLAITLGIKAAKHEWIMMTDAECRPNTRKWLATMAAMCSDDKQMVIGYTAYDDETPAYRRFERLHTAHYLIREDLCSTPYRHNGSNLLFRKSMFIEQDGYRGNLKYIRGEYDFLVNKYANRTNTALQLTPDSWLTEQAPTEKQWRNKHLFYMESRQHMMRTWRHRLPFNIDQCAMHLNYVLIIAAAAFSIVTQRWLLTAVAAIALVLTVMLRLSICKKSLRLYREDISSWSIIPYELGIVWHQLGYMLKYRKADKYDFISHKI